MTHRSPEYNNREAELILDRVKGIVGENAVRFGLVPRPPSAWDRVGAIFDALQGDEGLCAVTLANKHEAFCVGAELARALAIRDAAESD
jgi:hypothetical protein